MDKRNFLGSIVTALLFAGVPSAIVLASDKAAVQSTIFNIDVRRCEHQDLERLTASKFICRAAVTTRDTDNAKDIRVVQAENIRLSLSDCLVEVELVGGVFQVGFSKTNTKQLNFMKDEAKTCLNKLIQMGDLNNQTFRALTIPQ